MRLQFIFLHRMCLTSGFSVSWLRGNKKTKCIDSSERASARLYEETEDINAICTIIGIVPFSALQLLPAQKGNHKNHRKNANIGVFTKGNEEGYIELLYGILVIFCERYDWRTLFLQCSIKYCMSGSHPSSRILMKRVETTTLIANIIIDTEVACVDFFSLTSMIFLQKNSQCSTFTFLHALHLQLLAQGTIDKLTFRTKLIISIIP